MELHIVTIVTIAWVTILLIEETNGIGDEDVPEEEKMPVGTRIEILRAMAREAATFSTAAGERAIARGTSPMTESLRSYISRNKDAAVSYLVYLWMFLGLTFGLI